MKKDDRSSHQNFNANKEARLSVDIWRSRKAVKCLLQNISHCVKNIIVNVTLILQKRKKKQTQIKGKHLH